MPPLLTLALIATSLFWLALFLLALRDRLNSPPPPRIVLKPNDEREALPRGIGPSSVFWWILMFAIWPALIAVTLADSRKAKQ